MLKRCANIQQHIDRVGQFEPTIAAIYLIDRADLAAQATDCHHKAGPDSRFADNGILEIIEIAAPVPVVPAELPAGHPSRGNVSV